MIKKIHCKEDAMSAKQLERAGKRRGTDGGTTGGCNSTNLMVGNASCPRDYGWQSMRQSILIATSEESR
jgi:hypothetical protein